MWSAELYWRSDKQSNVPGLMPSLLSSMNSACNCILLLTRRFLCQTTGHARPLMASQISMGSEVKSLKTITKILNIISLIKQLPVKTKCYTDVLHIRVKSYIVCYHNNKSANICKFTLGWHLRQELFVFRSRIEPNSIFPFWTKSTASQPVHSYFKVSWVLNFLWW